MTSPFVSFVFPVHAAGFELLRRSILALESQTCGDFEVVIAIDSPDARAKKEPFVSLARNRSFPARVVASQRTPGNESLPHRNHTRNAGCDAAKGKHLWVLDSDMIADPNAVEHLKKVIKKHGASTCVTPCFAEPSKSPESWRAFRGDPWSLPRHEYARHSGRMTKCRRSTVATSVPMNKLVEGFPTMPRWLWKELGGFCEDYLAYGGNKVDTVRQLTTLAAAGLLEIRLLTSCLFLHQPHPRDPLRKNKAHRDKNWELYRARERDMKTGAPWWLEIEAKVRGHGRQHTS